MLLYLLTGGGTPIQSTQGRGYSIPHPDLRPDLDRGYPSSPDRGYPIKSWMGRYPMIGIPSSPDRLGESQGTPHPDLGWEYPHLDLGWGTPLSRPGMGNPPSGPGMGVPPPGWTSDGVPLSRHGIGYPPPPPQVRTD